MHASGFIHMRFFLERTEYLIGVTTNLQFASREAAQDMGPIVGKLGRRFRYRPELGKSLWPIWGSRQRRTARTSPQIGVVMTARDVRTKLSASSCRREHWARQKVRATPVHVSLRRNTENETGVQAARQLNSRPMRTIPLPRKSGA
jgi:hypothetical protein